MPKCKLCLNKEADKRNSHIIPKFMGKRLFEGSKPRGSLRIDISGRHWTIQDTPKEDFIFCSDCEEKFAKIEHYFSLRLKSIHNYNNEQNKFKLYGIGNNQLLECLNIPLNEMKLFNYSLVWKTSISNLNEFIKFKIPVLYEEKLRIFLNTYLTTSHTILKENLETITDETNLDSYFFKCVVKNEFSRGVFTAYEFGEKAFGLFLVDFIIFLYIDKNKIPADFKIISDLQRENTLIAMADIPRWKKINFAPLDNIGINTANHI